MGKITKTSLKYSTESAAAPADPVPRALYARTNHQIEQCHVHGQQPIRISPLCRISTPAQRAPGNEPQREREAAWRQLFPDWGGPRSGLFGEMVGSKPQGEREAPLHGVSHACKG